MVSPTDREELLRRCQALSEEGLSQSEISRRVGETRWIVRGLLAEIGRAATPDGSRKIGNTRQAGPRKPQVTGGGQIRSTAYLDPDLMARLTAEAELQGVSSSGVQRMALELYLGCCQSLREGTWKDQPIQGFRSMFPAGHELAAR